MHTKQNREAAMSHALTRLRITCSPLTLLSFSAGTQIAIGGTCFASQGLNVFRAHTPGLQGLIRRSLPEAPSSICRRHRLEAMEPLQSRSLPRCRLPVRLQQLSWVLFWLPEAVSRVMPQLQQAGKRLLRLLALLRTPLPGRRLLLQLSSPGPS